MRATTTAQLTALTGLDRKDGVRVWIATASATLVDFTDYSGVNYFDEASIRASLDQFSATASVSLFREVSGTTLAPLMSSPAPVAIGREIMIEVAVVAQSSSIGSGDWVELFRGTIDETDWGNDRLRLSCRDLGGRLLDTWIESEAAYGDDGSPEDMETVIQEILDDVLGASEVTLATPSSPSFGIVEYTQQRQSLADAIRAIVNLIGWDVRYVWDGTAEEFQLKLLEPDRTQTTPDHTFSADDYFAVRTVSQSTDGIRNAVTVAWQEGSTVTVTDSTSISEFRRRFMFLDSTNDPQISDSTKAAALAAAVVGDLAQPAVTQVTENAFFWPIELGDLYRWTANGVHYTSNQDLAVYGYEHRLSRGGNATAISVRGQPSGSAERWFKVESKVRRRNDSVEVGIPEPIPFATLAPQVDGSDNLTGVIAGNQSVRSIKILASKVDMPTFAEVDAETEIDGGPTYTTAQLGSIIDDATSSAMSVTEGETIYIAWIVNTLAGFGGTDSPLYSMIFEVPADADTTADLARPGITFGDDGELQLVLGGDSDTVGILATAAVNGTPTAIAAGTTMATTAGITATDTSVAVDTASGFGGYWCMVSDGAQSELIYAQSHGSNNLTVTPTPFQNNYASGATITRFFLKSSGGAGVLGQSGILDMDGSNIRLPTVAADIGGVVTVSARGINAAGELGPAVTGQRRRGDTEFGATRVQVTAVRSGDDVSVNFVISDPTHAISANPKYKRRDADDQTWDASYQTSWDTSTGVAGSSTDLVRQVTLTGDYTAIEWVIEVVDENGDAQVIGDTIDFASVVQIDKTLKLPGMTFVIGGSGYDASDVWNISASAEGPILQSEDVVPFFAPVIIPAGSVLSEIRVRMERHSSGALQVDFYHTNTLLAELNAGTSISTQSASLSYTVDGSPLWLFADLQGFGNGNESKLYWVEIDYSAPSYNKSY